MADLGLALASWSSRVGPFLANHLWQSTLFVLALFPAAVLLRRAPARLRYGLSLVASAKFLVPASLLVLAFGRLAPDLEGRIASSTLLPLGLDRLLNLFGGGPAGASAAPARPDLATALTLLWLAGTLAFSLRWASRHRAFARRIAGARRLAAGREVELLDRLRRRLGLARPVGLALLAGGSAPGVWGVLRPVLLLPEEMPRHLTPAELEAIFLHELVHVRRRDNLVANLHMALCCLLWFHPLLWLLDRRLLAEREEACDERVLELVGRAEAYARGLMKAVRFDAGWRLAGVSGARASNLRRRIEKLLAAPRSRRPSLAQRASLVAAVGLLLAFSVAAGTAAPRVAEQRCLAEARRAVAPAPDRCRIERVDATAAPAAPREPRALAGEGTPSRPGKPPCDRSKPARVGSVAPLDATG
jgi:beta-lactamase regulating signal transducer with metallopeptidase domain